MQKISEKTIIILLGALVIFEWVKFAKIDDSISHVEYEYRIAFINDYLFDFDLKKIGNEGWEIINARRASSNDTYGYELILKKSK